MVTVPSAGSVVASVVRVGTAGAHWVAPCWSQAGGNGSVVASVSVPSVENVGLSHVWMVRFATFAPGIRLSWVRPACTRLIGRAA